MLKSKVGHSIDANSFESGKQTATKAIETLNNPKIGLLYSSVKYNQAEVIKGVKEVIGDLPVIGCTSSGAIITNEGIIESNNGFSGMLLLDDPDLTIGVAASPKEKDARTTGQKVAYEAVKNSKTGYAPSYFYMVANPAEEESYLKGIQDVIGRVPFFGGSAADDAIAGDWQIFCNDQVFNDGVAVAFFYTDKEIATEYTGAYHETTNTGIITKISGNRTLVEIDGRPALEKYAEWVGLEPKDLMGGDLLVKANQKPLGIKDPIGNVTLVRHPMAGNEDMSMNIGNDLKVNTAVIQLCATVDELISSTKTTMQAAKEKLYKQNPGAYFLVHCGGRKVGIGDRLEEVYDNLKEVSNGVPFLTIFTFGEYGYHEHSANSCGGLMLSFTAFGKE